MIGPDRIQAACQLDAVRLDTDMDPVACEGAEHVTHGQASDDQPAARRRMHAETANPADRSCRHEQLPPPVRQQEPLLRQLDEVSRHRLTVPQP